MNTDTVQAPTANQVLLHLVGAGALNYYAVPGKPRRNPGLWRALYRLGSAAPELCALGARYYNRLCKLLVLHPMP